MFMILYVIFVFDMNIESVLSRLLTVQNEPKEIQDKNISLAKCIIAASLRVGYDL